jgi:hypothetical protein
MPKYSYPLTILFVLVGITVFAQDLNLIKNKKPHGTLFFTWGYHRDSYSNSTIHFKDTETPNGPRYNFTLHNAKAHDKPDMDDFFHTPPTVPQYVLTGGYFFNDKKDLGIELSWNHLKYVVTDNQVVRMTGTIDGQSYDLDTLITPGFVHYEHTNGNNYLIVSMLKRIPLLSSKDQNHRLSANFRMGPGVLIPKTYSTITINNNLYSNDGPFRVSGWVVGIGAALRYDIFKHFFIEPSLKGSYVNYTGAKLYGQGRAKHTFFSLQYIMAVGINLPIGQ